MFTRDKPRAANDLSELTGDPFMTGNISDAPNPEERQHYATLYDDEIALKLARAGVTPGHPAFDDLYTQAVNSDMTHSVEGLAHGHALPMTKREGILYSPQSEWDRATAQQANADAMLAEYARRNPDLAQDLDGLSAAVDVAMDFYRENGESPMADPNKFLKDVSYYHRVGARRSHSEEDYGRTGGIGASGGAASGWETPDQHPDNDGGMIGEIRALARARGW